MIPQPQKRPIQVVLLMLVMSPPLLLGMPMYSFGAEEDNIEDQLETFLPQSCFLSGKFQQEKIIVDLGEPLVSSGRFIFSCENGLIWSSSEPFSETAIYKAKGKHLKILPDGSSEVLSGRMHRELGNILNNLIGAKVDRLRKTFKISSSEEYVILEPKSKRLRKFMASIRMSLLDEGVNILMASKSESTSILISNATGLSKLNLSECNHLFPSPALACEWLLKQ